MRLERIAWNDATPPDETTLRGRLAADGFEAWSWTDAPGATYAPHSHDQDESLWVVAGEISFTVGDETYQLGPGDRLQLPAGTVHAAVAGAGGATYLVGERRSG